MEEIQTQIDNLFIFYFILVIVMFLFGCIVGYQLSKPAGTDEDKCDCKDVNECDKWCVGKQNFTRATNYSITEECKHPERLTQVLCSAGTCETTVEVCADCREKVSEPKTDC